MKHDYEIEVEDLLFRLADICRNAGLNGYDQVIISLGLIYLLSEEKSFIKSSIKDRPLYNHLELITELAERQFGEHNSSFDVKEQFFASLRKIENSDLRLLVWTISESILSHPQIKESIKIINLFTARSLMSSKYTSYFLSSPQLGELLKKIIDVKPGDRVYDPVAGIGILMSVLNLDEAEKVILQDINKQLIILAKLLRRYISTDENTIFYEGDSLTQPIAEEKSIDILIGELPFGKSRSRNRSMLHTSIEIISSDLPELFIQMSLSRLSPIGKAYLLIPDGFLFSRTRSSKTIKKQLIDQDLIECIISFPSGFLKPYSSVKSSLLILNQNKPFYRKNEVLFIDADQTESKSDRYLPNKIDVERTAKIYHTHNILPQDYSVQLNNREIIDNDLNLQVKRYLSSLKLNLADNLRPGEELIKLSDLISPIATRKNKLDNLPYVRIGDLAKDAFDFNLSLKDWKLKDNNFKGNIVNDTALLVARVGDNLKPTFYKFNNQPISLNPNVYPFKIDEKKIIKDYLLFELNSNYFKEQLESITSGTAQRAWSKKDFLELAIKVPNLSRQLEIAKQRKEALIKVKKQEIELLKDRLQVEDKGLEIISNFKHDFMGNLERISSGISVLKNFLLEKDEEGTNINMSESIVNIDGDEDFPSETLSEWIELLQTNIKNAINKLEYEIEQIKEDREVYHFEVENIYHLLRSIKKNYSSNYNFEIRITKGIGVKEVKELKALVDKNKIDIIIDNLISNAVNHGFEEKSNKKYLILLR